MVVQIILGCILTYLLGSIPFSYIIAKKVKGIDIRVKGEGNVGGRNVWHLVGKKYGILAGLLDVSKGYGAYWIGILFGLSPWWIWLCGFCVILGHNFPVFLKGRGGKGIAAALGFLLGMQPLIVIISGLLIGIIYLPSRSFHLAVSIGMASIPILWFVVLKKPWQEILLLIALLCSLGLKRIIDEPYMRKIKQESGW
jgi:glycerol-3-phosphate acyltransferase PlsY